MNATQSLGFSLDHHNKQRAGVEPIHDLSQFLKNEVVINQIETIREMEEEGFIKGDPDTMKKMEGQIDSLNSILSPNKGGQP